MKEKLITVGANNYPKGKKTSVCDLPFLYKYSTPHPTV